MKLHMKSAVAGLALTLALGTAPFAAELKIGVLVPTTGGQASYGQDMANAVQLAMDELNKAGGANTYSAVVGDDGCDPQQAVNAATKLASSGIVAVIGGYCSGATIPTLKIFGDAKLPMVITAANSTKLIPANPGNAFMINSTGNDQVAKALDVWKARSNTQSMARSRLRVATPGLPRQFATTRQRRLQGRLRRANIFSA